MDSDIGWLLGRAAHSWKTVVDVWMQDLGLTQSRWIALLHLKRMGQGVTQSQLAADIGIEQPSMLRTLNQLEDSGLIERRADRQDARRRTLWFTAAGTALLEKVEARAVEGRSHLLDGLSQDQRLAFRAVLQQLLENAHGATQRPGSLSCPRRQSLPVPATASDLPDTRN